MVQFARALSMAALFAVACCELVRAQPAQPQTPEAPPTVIAYSDPAPSARIDVTGAYRVPGSSVVIIGYHPGSPLGLLFGAAGVLAQEAINTEQSKETAKADQATWQQLQIAQQASDLTQNLLASGRYGQTFTFKAEPDAPTVSVIPYVAITSVTETEIVPSVILKATLKRPGEPARTTQYVCCVTQPLPAAGDNGLTAKGGAPLKAVLAHQLETAVNVMLQDLAGAYPRDGSKTVGVKGIFPFQRIKLYLGGYNLFEDEHSLIFAPKGSLLYSGSQVFIMDKSAISIERPRK